jgi:hypothetical protein
MGRKQKKQCRCCAASLLALKFGTPSDRVEVKTEWMNQPHLFFGSDADTKSQYSGMHIIL